MKCSREVDTKDKASFHQQFEYQQFALNSQAT